MDYVHYLGCCLLGAGPALAIFFLLRAKRRAWIPPLAWWLFLILGTVIIFYGMFHSTLPSFSARITAVGEAYDYRERVIDAGRHSTTAYGFRLVPEDGKSINIETEIILPDTATPAVFDGRIFRVVYLADRTRILRNEAVDITILSGENVGFHDSVDASPFGKWLAIPLGAALAIFGYAGLRCMEDDAAAAASDDEDTPPS